MTTTPQLRPPTAESMVLWDDDYRNHIWRLMELLERERVDVSRLRKERDDLLEALECAKVLI